MRYPPKDSAAQAAREAIKEALRQGPCLGSDIYAAVGGNMSSTRSLVSYYMRELLYRRCVIRRQFPGRAGEAVWILNTARRAA